MPDGKWPLKSGNRLFKEDLEFLICVWNTFRFSSVQSSLSVMSDS